MEKPINLAVVSPLLFIGQFYLSPFDLRAEKNVEVSVEDEVNILENGFRYCVNQAINRELNKLRRDGFTGQGLFNQLRQIYRQHNMHEWQDNMPTLSQPIPIISRTMN